MQEGQILDNWLFSEAPSQLTYQGIVELHEKMQEAELGVFFRNNHFNTISKHEGNLYLLVTDVGFQHKKNIVWELLNEVGPGSGFVNV